MSVPVVIYLTVVMMLTAQGETLAHLKFSANPLSPWLQYLGFRIGLSVIPCADVEQEQPQSCQTPGGLLGDRGGRAGGCFVCLFLTPSCLGQGRQAPSHYLTTGPCLPELRGGTAWVESSRLILDLETPRQLAGQLGSVS